MSPPSSRIMRRVEKFNAIELHDSLLYGWEVASGRNAVAGANIDGPSVTLNLGLLIAEPPRFSYKPATLRFLDVCSASLDISLVDLRRCPDIFEATCTLASQPTTSKGTENDAAIISNRDQALLQWDLTFSGVDGAITVVGRDFVFTEVAAID
jgi:hypothetical protein